MRIISEAIKRIFLMYFASYLQVHFIVLIVSFLANMMIFYWADKSIINDNFIILLNGMGVMATFFIMTIEKVNATKLVNKYNKKTNLVLTKSSISQGNRVLNLIYSITFSSFISLLSLYLLAFLGVKFSFLLIYLVFNIFIGFMVVLVVWHLIELEN
jgi:hypothetical protein